MGAKISDTDIISEDGLDKIVELITTMKPWVCDRLGLQVVVLSVRLLTDLCR